MTHSDVTVLCVDDHNLVRECVIAVLEQDPAVRVTADAQTVAGAVACFKDVRPDVVLVSLQSRGLDSFEVIRAIRRAEPRARIVVYAMEETEAAYVALEAGATGFVFKDAAGAELIRAVTDVHTRHDAPLDDIKSRLEARCGQPTLTAREVEIIDFFSQGHRSHAIATTLRISEHTVKAHMKKIYRKLNVQGRAAALAVAARRGFVRVSPEPHAPQAYLRSTERENVGAIAVNS